jgi:hypothetical protein
MTGKESNTSPLNQKCLKALKALGLKVDTSYPYSLQLAEWALENNLVAGLAGRFTAELLEQVRVMYGWENPSKYLLDPETKDPPESDSPESLGSELVENLYENLRKHMPALRVSGG